MSPLVKDILFPAFLESCDEIKNSLSHFWPLEDLFTYEHQGLKVKTTLYVQEEKYPFITFSFYFLDPHSLGMILRESDFSFLAHTETPLFDALKDLVREVSLEDLDDKVFFWIIETLTEASKIFISTHIQCQEMEKMLQNQLNNLDNYLQKCR